MISNTIYAPYFYIIRHTKTNRYYAGSKYAKGSTPSQFWVPGGYYTSSNIIKRIIQEEGENSFEIVRIRTFEHGEDAYSYETKFLRKVNAATNDKFLNGHNNAMPCYGTDEYKNMLIKMYGEDNPSKLDWVKQKKKETHSKNYGVPYRWQSIETKQELVKHIQEKYNDSTITNCSQVQEVKDKKIESVLRVYGVTNVFQSELIKDKIKQTNLQKYGCEYASQSQECKDKINVDRKQKSTRPEVNIIKQYVKKFNVSLGRGWYQNSTDDLIKRIEILKLKYGDIDDTNPITLDF